MIFQSWKAVTITNGLIPPGEEIPEMCEEKR
jgi:hypothetical protein